jgi:hypothetical protein
VIFVVKSLAIFVAKLKFKVIKEFVTAKDFQYAVSAHIPMHALERVHV